APYSGDLFSFGSGGGSDRASSAKVSPFYIGLMTGLFEPDLGDEYDVANSYGVIIGYDDDTLIPGLSLELLLGATTAAASALDLSFPDEYTTTMIGLYTAYRSPGSFYAKGRLGYIRFELEEDTYSGSAPNFVLDETTTLTDSGVSYGIGFGYGFSKHSRLEFEYTTASLDFDINPRLINLSYLYNF
ncbi:MAG: outer membrane beta-barrel protein, partial [Gammaproteobacteria bacterium]